MRTRWPILHCKTMSIFILRETETITVKLIFCDVFIQFEVHWHTDGVFNLFIQGLRLRRQWRGFRFRMLEQCIFAIVAWILKMIDTENRCSEFVWSVVCFSLTLRLTLYALHSLNFIIWYVWSAWFFSPSLRFTMNGLISMHAQWNRCTHSLICMLVRSLLSIESHEQYQIT